MAAHFGIESFELKQVLGMVVHCRNHGTWEVEAGELTVQVSLCYIVRSYLKQINQKN
jgi:hypothetical protein